MENENKKLLCEHVEEIDECRICQLEFEVVEQKKEIKELKIWLTILFICTILWDIIIF